MSYPKYRVDKEKDGRFAVRKFTGFDHMWAEYSKPLEYFDTREEAMKVRNEIARLHP